MFWGQNIRSCLGTSVTWEQARVSAATGVWVPECGGSVPWKWGKPPTVCPLKVPADQGGDLPRNPWRLWTPVVQWLCLGGGGQRWRLACVDYRSAPWESRSDDWKEPDVVGRVIHGICEQR